MFFTKVGYYDTSDRTNRLEDFDLWCRIKIHGEDIFNLSEPLLDYYESSISVKKRNLKFRVREIKLREYWRKRMGRPFKLLIVIFIKFVILILLPQGVYLFYRKIKFKINPSV
jgi:glycosyltransferase EpsE